jgi:hypothetical protein
MAMHNIGAERTLAISEMQKQLSGESLIVDVAFALSPCVDASTVFEAVSWLTKRHDSLRTTLDLPARIQTVHDWSPNVVDRASVTLEGFDASPSLAAAAAELARVSRRNLDISALPTLRCRVAQWQGRATVVYIATHHAFADFGSVNVLVRDILAFLDFAATHGVAAAADPTRTRRPLQFWEILERTQSFCDAPATWKAGGVGARALDLYASRFSDAPSPVLGNPEGATGDMCYMLSTIDAATTAALRAVAAEIKSSLFHILLSAHEESVAKVSNRADVITFSLIHGRTGQNTQDAVGLLASDVVFRHRIGTTSRRQQLSAVWTDALRTYAVLSVPIAVVARRSPVVRRLYKERAARRLVFQSKANGIGGRPASSHYKVVFSDGLSSTAHWSLPGVLLLNVEEKSDLLEIEVLFDRSTWSEDLADQLICGLRDACLGYVLKLDAAVGS